MTSSEKAEKLVALKAMVKELEDKLKMANALLVAGEADTAYWKAEYQMMTKLATDWKIKYNTTYKQVLDLTQKLQLQQVPTLSSFGPLWDSVAAGVASNAPPVSF